MIPPRRAARPGPTWGVSDIKLDINEVRKLNEQRDAINALDFKSIEWMDGDTLLPVTPEIQERWRFIGLCNTNFVELEYWTSEDALAETRL